ncbi:EF-hand domain-containing protein [Rhabdochromatium marinum]|uniref:EF-hand domain-containing protein n=1 Tax=Rhabdochromatium marinum TaxID=48729 RepID=UPI00190716D3|nr:EF-hand domain-containing protein [Rhabdochromatium marinum]
MKKLTLVTCVGPLTLCGGLALAMPGGPPGGGQFPPEADLDGDGHVTRDEMDLHRTNTFDMADTNGDGQLSLSELQTYEEAERATRQAEAFARLDADANGVVTEDEFINGAPETGVDVAARLYALAVGDATGLSAETLAAIQGPEGASLHQFASLDTDGNSALSLEEFLAPPAGRGPGEGARPGSGAPGR